MRDQFLPFALPSIGEEEIQEVVDSLRSGWVTTGPKVKQFEEAFAAYTGARHAVAVGSCTAALHISLAALGIGPGDEVIVPTLTFCATANVVTHSGATPILVDVDEFGQISIECIEKAITPRTRAIIPVHYSGQAADLNEILDLTARHGMDVIEDAAHAAGSVYQGRKIGTFGRTTAFSFYATKNMTTGEGGMITTDDEELATRMRRLAVHGMSRDAWKRYTEAGSWYYEITEPGFKGNMTDLQASIGIHQLRRLDGFISRRQVIASLYTQAFNVLPGVKTPVERPDRNHTYHLYPIRLDEEKAGLSRSELIEALKAARIGTSVHFVPLHRHPYYRDRFALLPTNFPVAEDIYRGLISLPIYPAMVDTDVQDVIEAVQTIFKSAFKSTVAA